MSKISKNQTRSPPEPRKPEFSKIIIAAVGCTYFVGVTAGTIALFRVLGVLLDLSDPSVLVGVLTAYFSFIGAPVGIAIGFYGWKSKAENVLKLRLAHPDHVEKIDLGNIV